MKTSIDLASIIYKIIKKSDIKNVINGNVYLGSRPFDSKKNDIVVNTITLGEEQMQFGTVNVQIFAQNNHIGSSYYPDYTTLNNAVKVIKPLLKDLYLDKEEVYIDVEAERYYQVENAQEWVVVLRLLTRNIN